MVTCLIRNNFYSRSLQQLYITEEKFLNLVQHPLIGQVKEQLPLAIYGHLIEHPYPSPENSNLAYYFSENVSRLDLLQLDYDSGISIDEWKREFKQFRHIIYTSHSHGFKGNSDRFRVLIPLDKPIYKEDMGRFYKQAMTDFWGCDPSCFDRGHCQLLPAIRTKDAPYRYDIKLDGLRFELPAERIAKLQEDEQKVSVFNEALFNFYSQYRTDDEDHKRENLLKWAEKKLSEAMEGSRNSTCFQVLSYLKKNGFDYYDVAPLSYCLSDDFQKEYDKMARRMFKM